MTTVTAKTLRDNLSHYLDRLQKGEEIMIIRHSEIIGTLKPVTQGTIPNGATIAAMLERNIQSFSANKNLAPKNMSTRELYRRAIDDKYDV